MIYHEFHDLARGMGVRRVKISGSVAAAEGFVRPFIDHIVGVAGEPGEVHDDVGAFRRHHPESSEFQSRERQQAAVGADLPEMQRGWRQRCDSPIRIEIAYQVVQ